MKRTLSLLTLLFILLSSLRAFPARSGYGAGTRIVVSDKSNGEILVGATVRIVSGADTLRGVTARLSLGYMTVAEYNCEKLFRDSVELTVSYLGYKEFNRRYSPYEFSGFIQARMETDSTAIGQVVVVGKQIAMVYKGDTVVYNAGAFKTLDDDRLSELMKQLPGVEIRENRIFADGEEVKRVYVDGRNLFGSDPNASLKDMVANDVKSVRVYEEQSPDAKFTGDKSAKKEKVMDVETKSKRKTLRGGEAEAVYGASIEQDYSGRREIRHAEKLALYRHAENGSIRFRGSNSKDEGNRGEGSMQSRITPSKQTEVNLSHEYRRGDSVMVMTSGWFQRGRTSNVTGSLTDYFPTDDYAVRLDESLSEYLSKNLAASLNNHTLFRRKRHMLHALVDLQYNDGQSFSHSSTTQTIDREVTRTQTNSDSDTRSMRFNGRVDYSFRFTEKMQLSLTAAGSYGDNDNEGWQVDTLASVPGLRTILRNGGDSRQWDLQTGASFLYKTGKYSNLSVTYEYSRRRDDSRRLSIDYLDDPRGRVDTTNSYKYAIAESGHRLSAFWGCFKKDFMCHLNLEAALRDVARDEEFPATERYPRRFLQLNPGVMLQVGKSRNRFNFQLHSNSQTIPTEMLRPTLNTTNPLALQAGNPDLKMSNEISGSAGYSRSDARSARTFSISFNGSYTFNYIATRRTLFLEDTYLELYDYTAQRGSQLTTQLNVGGCYRVESSFRYSQQLIALRSTLNANLKYGFSQQPYFLGEALYESGSHSLSADLGFESGFSTKVRIQLSSSTTLSRYRTRSECTDDLRELVQARINLRFGKYFGFVGTVYEFYCNSRSKELTRHNVVLNASAGRKFGKKNRFALSVGAVDILNRPDYATTRFETDYIRTSSTSYLGRYAYIRVAYTFD